LHTEFSYVVWSWANHLHTEFSYVVWSW
jgi:hypothetical protein